MADYLFNEFKNRIIISGIVHALKPICIGAGEEGFEPTHVKSPALKDAHGNPIIPGSSLKGVLRSSIERIINSFGKDLGLVACNILEENSKDCLRHANYIEKIEEKLINIEESKKTFERAKLVYENSCDVCRLFGGKYIASKIQIKDLNFNDKSGARPFCEIRDGIGIDRDTGTTSKGAKFDYEVVPAGTEFEFYMIAENLDDTQMKLLDLVKSMLQSGELCVGGKVSRGMGNIKLTITREKMIQSLEELMKEYNMRSERVSVDV
ncbi:MAG: CRISPR-associated RAMP protein [Clostridiaceae bacterium]|nr:CRISPR-associated RAMP protein [Clostridiaceae bacterium]